MASLSTCHLDGLLWMAIWLHESMIDMWSLLPVGLPTYIVILILADTTVPGSTCDSLYSQINTGELN